jgi:hypothetical protein
MGAASSSAMAAVFFLAIALPPNIKERAGRPTLSSSYYLTVKIIPQRRFFCKEKNKVFRTNTGVFLRFGTAFFTGCLPLPRKTTSVRFISRKTQKTDAPPFCGHVRRLCLFYSAADSSSEVVLSSSSPFTGLFCAMTSFASRTFWISLMRTEPVG